MSINESLFAVEEQLKGLETKDAQQFIYQIAGILADLVKRNPKTASGHVCPRDYHYIQRMLDGCNNYTKEASSFVLARKRRGNFFIDCDSHPKGPLCTRYTIQVVSCPIQQAGYGKHGAVGMDISGKMDGVSLNRIR